MDKKKFEVCTIGSDPEFGVSFRGMKTNISAGFLTNNSISAIRTDAHSDIGEFTVKPATDPVQATEEIKKLIEKIVELYPFVYITGGNFAHIKNPKTKKGKGDRISKFNAHKDPIGGHLHCGIKRLSRDHDARKTFANYMDCIVAIPLLLLEKDAGIERRSNRTSAGWGPYGRFGNFHTPGYGMEYRQPSCWMVSKEVTLATFTLQSICTNLFEHRLDYNLGILTKGGQMVKEKYKTLGERIVGKIKSSDDNHHSPTANDNRKELNLYTRNYRKAKTFIRHITKTMRSYSLRLFYKMKKQFFWKYYRNNLSPLIRMIKNSQRWKKDNILPRWGIKPKYTIPYWKAIINPDGVYNSNGSHFVFVKDSGDQKYFERRSVKDYRKPDKRYSQVFRMMRKKNV